MNFLRTIFFFFFSVASMFPMAAHSFEGHKADMYAVIPLKQSPATDEWMRYVSYDLIDNYRGEALPEYGGKNFYEYLKEKYPPFKCKHRVLFHWGYNSRPWTDYLQKKVEGYKWNEEKTSRFRGEIVREQQRRNREANELTEKLFGLSSSGKEASVANALISIAYDIHLVGDYTSDNSDLEGLQLFSSVVGDLINSIRKIDETISRDFIKKIQTVVNTDENVQVRADRLMDVLHKNGPSFFKNARKANPILARIKFAD